MSADAAASLFILGLASVPLAVIAVCCCCDSWYAWLRQQLDRIHQWSNSPKSTTFIIRGLVAALGVLKHIL